MRGERIEKVTDGATAIPAEAKVIDLSSSTVAAGTDRFAHASSCGARTPAKGGYDANILNAGIALRAARATYAVRRALEQGFTTIRDLETEGAGYGDIEIKQAIEERDDSRTADLRGDSGISTTGGYNLEGYAPELEMPKGVQIVDGPGGSAQSCAPATGAQRRLAQGVHDPTVRGGQGGNLVAAHADGGRAAGDRG